MSDPSGVAQYRALADAEKIIQLGDPVAHIHGLAAAGLKLGEVEIHRNNEVEGLDFFQCEVILGHGHVRLVGAAARPGRQSHVGLGGVGAGVDDLGCRLSMRAPVHLVLHGRKELPRGLHAWIVINPRGVNLQHLAPESLFRRPDVPDARQQLIKIIAAPGLLEPLIVHRETLDDILPQPLCGPDAELRAAMRLYAVADGDDDVQVIELDLPADLATTFTLNCCKFCNS